MFCHKVLVGHVLIIIIINKPCSVLSLCNVEKLKYIKGRISSTFTMALKKGGQENIHIYNIVLFNFLLLICVHLILLIT